MSDSMNASLETHARNQATEDSTVVRKLPTRNGEALASLASCYTNLDPSCDFHNRLRLLQFQAAWGNPAPTHCPLKRGAKSPELPLYPDRLGVNMDKTCDLVA